MVNAKIFNLGVQPEYPSYLQRKIILSNKIGILTGTTVALPFIFISWIHFRPIAIIPAIGMLVCFSTLFFNYLKAHNLARILIGALPSTLASIYGAYLNHSGQPALPSIAMLTVSFSFLIFLVFDIREKGLLIGMGIYVSTLIIAMDWLNNAFEVDMDTEVIATGYLATITLVISIIVGIGSILILVVQNANTENKAFQLLQLSEANGKEMLAKEVELNDHLKKLNLAQAEEKKRKWVSDGLAAAIKIIRDQKEFQPLCDRLVSFMVRYLNANQGGLFLLDDAQNPPKFLKLIAAFAYERKKYLQKDISIGQGLLGQAYLEGDYVHLTEIPEKYVTITSGLGGANPRSLLIMPLKMNDVVLGVFEVASFKTFEAHEINFLELLGEDIAAAVHSRRVDEQTRNLLKKMQQQANEMRQQEEEMRQNMEELSATQEEMGRKEKDYVSRMTQLQREVEQYKGSAVLS